MSASTTSRGKGGHAIARWAAIVSCAAFAPTSLSQITFRNGDILDLRRGSTPSRSVPLAPDSVLPNRLIIQLAGPLTDTLRADLLAQGLRVLAPLGNDAFFAHVVEPNARAWTSNAAVLGWSAIRPDWKIHPIFLAQRARDIQGGGTTPTPPQTRSDPSHQIPDENAIRDSHTSPDPAAPPPQPIVAPLGPDVVMFVQLFDDVGPDADTQAAMTATGVQIESWVASMPIATVKGPASAIDHLAALDAVQWIEPALPQLSETNAESRARTGADIAQSAPYNLSGLGVRVLVYDGGRVLGDHADLIGRVVSIDDAPSAVTHATHVAGTIAGSGAASAGRYRGMAPNATILSAALNIAGTAGWLYTNPADLESDYTRAFEAAAALANNSIGTNVAANGFDCAWYGDYGAVSALLDTIIRGDTSVTGNTPLPMIWSAGNERASSRCISAQKSPYHTIAPPAGTKNAIVVGAINANDDSMTAFSSWGPTDDGRIKPDLVAPGCQTDAELGITSCSANGDTAYDTFCGTSMATPAVTGIAALLLEDYRRLTSPSATMRTATIKAILAQTAVDLGAKGPDYIFGFGSVRAIPAINLLRAGSQLLESVATQGSGDQWTIDVPPAAGPLRLTLAWDDAPGIANVGSTLVNDLDLVLTDPLGRRMFPWTLDPAQPQSLAVRSVPDRVNNIEQIDVDAPIPGRWKVQVRGSRVPVGPQPFALASSLPLLFQGPASWFDVVGTGRALLSDSIGRGGTGNGNSFIDPGEHGVKISVEAVNNGVTLYGVTARLRPLDPRVHVHDDVVHYPDLITGIPAAGRDPFLFDVDPSFPCGLPIEFRVDLTFASSGDNPNPSGPGGEASFTLSLPTGTTPGLGPALTYRFTGPPVTIPDAAPDGTPGVPADILLTVADAPPVAKVVLRFDGYTCTSQAGATTVGLAHTFIGDLRISLTSPWGTTVTVLDRSGGTGNNLCGTTFDDDATATISQAADAPFSGVYIPAQPFVAFSGEDPNGVWRLRVQDFSNRDTGTVRRFSLLLREYREASCQPPVCPCLADFDGSDGVPDISDISEYVDSWLAGTADADTDCSGGAPDSLDLTMFFNAWLAGGC